MTIFLLLLYSFSSIGATVKAHLCAGKVQQCSCAKSNKKDTCCTEKISFVKKQDLHQSVVAQTAKQPIIFTSTSDAFYTRMCLPVLVQPAIGWILSKTGQLFTGPPIYALDCLYLI